MVPCPRLYKFFWDICSKRFCCSIGSQWVAALSQLAHTSLPAWYEVSLFPQEPLVPQRISVSKRSSFRFHVENILLKCHNRELRRVFIQKSYHTPYTTSIHWNHFVLYLEISSKIVLWVVLDVHSDQGYDDAQAVVRSVLTQFLPFEISAIVSSARGVAKRGFLLGSDSLRLFLGILNIFCVGFSHLIRCTLFASTKFCQSWTKHSFRLSLV